MHIQFADIEATFQPWRPDVGQLNTTLLALDTETTLIDPVHHWLTPTYVLGAVFDGERGYFITRDHIEAFLALHQDVELVMHSAAFDLAVLQQVAPGTDIYDRVDRHLIWDTYLLHRLYRLATTGDTAGHKGESTLEKCASDYLGIELPKDVKDSKGKPVRLSYHQWLGRAPQEIEPVYLEYLAKDVMVTYLLHEELQTRLQRVLEGNPQAFGYVSSEWLSQQQHRWGPQTHHIQLKGAIVLRSLTAEGLHIDTDRRDELAASLDEQAQQLREELSHQGYVPGRKGNGKALQEIFKQFDYRHPELEFERTPTGDYATSQSALEQLQGLEPFVDALVKYRAVEKLQSTYLNKMTRVLHPSFNPLVETGRTSSFGEINAQNLPRDGGVRSCIVPPADHVFVVADFCMAELGTLAQSVQSQWGLESAMGSAIFTLTGRLRAGASFCARHNTVFQGLAADGAKLALWHVWRAGYKIVNFVHDELVVAVPETENLTREAEQIAALMRRGMHEVVPDIHIEVEWDVVDRWSKGASVKLDNGGYLAVDSPTKEPAQVGTSAQGQVVTPVTMSPLRGAASVV